MSYSFRRYNWLKDFSFHRYCFSSSIKDIMFDNYSNIFLYMLPWRYSIKYVCYDSNTENIVSMASFKKRGNQEFEVAGFVPEYNQNKGVGLYAAVGYFNLFFQEFPNSTLYSCSKASNTNAIKLVSAIGFETIVQNDRCTKSKLTKEQFYSNAFTMKMLNRMKRG